MKQTAFVAGVFTTMCLTSFAPLAWGQPASAPPPEATVPATDGPPLATSATPSTAEAATATDSVVDNHDELKAGGQVQVHIAKQVTDFGRLHLQANLLGYQFAKIESAVSTFSAAFELHSRLWVRGTAVTPFLLAVGSDPGQWRLDAGINLFVVDKVRLENETIQIASDASKNYSTKLKLKNRVRYGLGGSLMVSSDAIQYDPAMGATMNISSKALTLVAGLAASSTHGFEGSVKGFGARKNYRWTHGGIELLMDVARSYDTQVTIDAGRLGGRLWAESMFFPKLGMSGRAELGKFPGGVGWIGMFSMGISLHML